MPGVLGCPVLSVVSVLGVISILVVVPVVGSGRVVGTIPAHRDEVNSWPGHNATARIMADYGFPGLDQPG